MPYRPSSSHSDPGHAEPRAESGTAFESVCRTCGYRAAGEFRFCPRCGSRLSEDAEPSLTSERREREVMESLRALIPKPLTEKMRATANEIVGERRQVTVLAVNIRIVPTSASGVDSETLYLLSNEATRLLGEVVFELEGTVDKCIGDSLLVLFGMPIAHEDDAEIAVRAALGIKAALQPLERRIQHGHGADLQIRMGIHTGWVIAGQVPTGRQVAYTVVGNTIDHAQYLRGLAKPNTIVVSHEARQQTNYRFVYKPLDTSEDGQQGAGYRLVSFRSQPGKMRGLPGALVPMIGREEPLIEMHDALTAAIDTRRCQVVLVTGEAGVGKSRLVGEFCDAVERLGIKPYQAGCQSYTREKTLWLTASILRDIMGIADPEPMDKQRDRVEQYLASRELFSRDLGRYIMNIMGLDLLDADMDARLRHMDGGQLKMMTQAAVGQILLAELNLGPVVLVLDDLHWIDPASIDFLRHVLETAVSEPMLLVLVARSSAHAAMLEELAPIAGQTGIAVTDIRLGPLSEVERQLLIGSIVTDTSQESESLRRQVAKRSEGNPFFAEEILRMLIDKGGLLRTDGTWRVSREAEAMLDNVPPSVSGLIMARIHALPETHRRILQRAAVLGRAFRIDLLECLQVSAREELEEHLRMLEAGGLIGPTPSGSAQGYEFRHALIRDAVYETLLKRDRERLHGRAAEAIQRLAHGSPIESAEALAYHYSKSATPNLAVPFLIEAADSAVRRSASEIAVDRYQEALALLSGQPQQSSAEVAHIELGLGRAFKFMGDFARAGKALNEAMQQLSHLGAVAESPEHLPSLVHCLREMADLQMREGLAREAISSLETGLEALGEQGAQAHPILWRMLIDRYAWISFRQGQLDQAFSLASSATVSLQTTGRDDPMTIASLHNTLGGICWQRGEVEAAIEHVKRSLQLYQSVSYAWGMAIADTNLGVLTYSEGLWAEAEEHLERANAVRKENGYLPELAVSLNNLGQLHMGMGKHEQAREDLEASLAISRRLGDGFGEMYAHIGLGHLAMLTSRLDEASRHIQEAQSHQELAGTPYAAQSHWLLALIRAGQGHLDAGLQSAKHALQLALDSGSKETEADCRRVLGILHARIEAYPEAEALLQTSVDLCVQLDLPYGRALGLMELGRLRLQLARSNILDSVDTLARAEEPLVRAQEEFRRLGAAHDLKEVAMLLREVRADTEGRSRAIDHRASPSSPPRGTLADSRWYVAAILWLDLLPHPEADEEAVFISLSQVLPSLTKLAEENHGRVIQRQSGLTAVFGAPEAHEDDAERAVETAYLMAQRVGEFSDTGECQLAYRVALSFGEIIAGNAGSPYPDDFVVSGEPVQEAQVLAEKVPSGKIWVTDRLRGFAERVFTYEATSDDGQGPWQLAGTVEKPEPARGLPGFESQLVGRRDSLGTMVSIAGNLDRGIGGLIWIEGEPGIGKSRLMREFASQLRGSGASIWSGNCSPQRSTHAFSLLSSLLLNALSATAGDAPEHLGQLVETAFQEWPSDAGMARPYVELVLGIQPEEAIRERLSLLQPEQLRQQMFVAVRRLFQSLASHGPMVLLLDDLHWVDPISAELLVFLMSLVTSVPILFVCAQRRQGADAPNDRLVKAQSLIPDQTAYLGVDRLSVDESAALLDELLSPGQLPAPLRAALLNKCEGNPYFIEEFVQMLLERGIVARAAGSVALLPEAPLGDLPLPSSLDTLIRSRIDALPADLRDLLLCASVLGEPFDAQLLGTVSGASDTLGGLHRLALRQLVHQENDTAFWRFNHSLIGVVAYASILRTHRRAMHHDVALALEAEWAGREAEHSEELAYHFLRAEANCRALLYLVLAGERAAARHANEEARSYLEDAARLLETERETPDELRWRIAAGLGDVYRTMGQLAESTSALEAGLGLVESARLGNLYRAGLYRRLGETHQKHGQFDSALACYRMALAALGTLSSTEEKKEAARAQSGIAWTRFLQGQFSDGSEAGEEAVALAESTNALAELAAAENILGGIQYRQGNAGAALNHTQRAAALREQMGYSWGVAASLSNLGVLAVNSGDWQKARFFFENSLALRQEMGDVEGVAIVHNNLGTLCGDQGDLNAAESHFRQSLGIARPFQMSYHITNAGVGLARVLMLKGDTEAAAEHIAASIATAQEIGAKDLLSEVYCIKAENWMAEDAWREAKACAEKAVDLAVELGDPNLQATAWRALSEIALEQGLLKSARAALDQAKQVLDGDTDQLVIGRVAVQAGRVYLAEGRMADAEEELRVAREAFLRLGAAIYLKQVEQVVGTVSM